MPNYGTVVPAIELSINKQSVTLDCVIIYEFPAFCKQTPWRIQRSNKEVSMQIISQNVFFALSITYLDKNNDMNIHNDILLKNTFS